MVNEEELNVRFKDAPWSDQQNVITVGGVGGIGSWLALMLNRVGHTVMAYDHDSVGDENIGGGQMYGPSQVGMQKTTALRNNINMLVGSKRFTGMGTFEKGSVVSNICIATFDNMESRKDMFETWSEEIKGMDKSVPKVFINVATGPEQVYMQVIDRPSRKARWIEEWQPSDKVPDLPCSFKSTTHNMSLAASLAVSALNNALFNFKIGERLRYVPYRMMVDLTLMTFSDDE